MIDLETSGVDRDRLWRVQRAKMSDARLSDAAREYERDAHHMGAPSYVIAEREARAILAETERGLSIHEHTFGMLLPVALRSCGPEWEALAESLAAFVGA